MFLFSWISPTFAGYREMHRFVLLLNFISGHDHSVYVFLAIKLEAFLVYSVYVFLSLLFDFSRCGRINLLSFY